MRAAGSIAAEVFLPGKPGPARHHHRRARRGRPRLVIRRGAYPSPLNYRGFPKSVCTSVNEVICHGIPDNRRLADGDIVNVDVTVFFDGVHGDTSATFCVGDVDEDARRLVRVTREA